MTERYIQRMRELMSDACAYPSISLAAASGGGLPDGTLQVRVSALTEFGETIPCPRVSLVVTDTQKVTITISRVPQARGYRVYASMATSAETYQTQIAAFTEATSTVVISSVSSGSALPTSDTATLYASRNGYNEALQGAVRWYSSRFPRKVDAPLTPGYQHYALPDAWDESRSALIRVRDDGTGDSETPDYVYPPDVRVVNDQLVFASSLSGDDIYVEFTAPHILDSVEETIPEEHYEALCLVGAHYVASEVAARYAHIGAKQISADTVQYEQRPTTFREMADRFLEQACAALGLTKDGTKSEAAVARWRDYEHSGGVRW